MQPSVLGRTAGVGSAPEFGTRVALGTAIRTGVGVAGRGVSGSVGTAVVTGDATGIGRTGRAIGAAVTTTASAAVGVACAGSAVRRTFPAAFTGSSADGASVDATRVGNAPHPTTVRNTTGTSQDLRLMVRAGDGSSLR